MKKAQTMKTKQWLAGLSLALAVLVAAPAMAADEHGHDHGAPAAADAPALPRFAAVSEAFELVGIVSGTHVALYLDRFEDNTPVKDARIELEIAGAKVAVEPHEGAYEATLAAPLQPGVIPVTATVVAGQESDILAADLDLHEEEHADEAQASAWRRYAPWAAALAVALVAIAWLGLRASRRARMGGAA